MPPSDRDGAHSQIYAGRHSSAGMSKRQTMVPLLHIRDSDELTAVNSMRGGLRGARISLG